MSWQAPKTDWAVRYDDAGNYIGDYFNASDYKRIKGNLEYLTELAATATSETMVREFPHLEDVTVESFCTAEMIDALDTTVQRIAAITWDPGIGSSGRWVGNGPAPTAEDLNRIESACILLYNSLIQQVKALPRLTFVLGGVQF